VQVSASVAAPGDIVLWRKYTARGGKMRFLAFVISIHLAISTTSAGESSATIWPFPLSR